MISAGEIIAALGECRFSLENEKRLQVEIADCFDVAGITYEREVRVTGGIIDFRCGRVGVEIKIDGSKRAVFRQLERYAEDESLDEIVLATSFAMGLPETINGKAAHLVSLGRAWL